MKNSLQRNAFLGFDRPWASGISERARRVTVIISMGFHKGIRFDVAVTSYRRKCQMDQTRHCIVRMCLASVRQRKAKWNSRVFFSGC